MSSNLAVRKVIGTFVAVSTEKVDPKVRNASVAVTVAAFVTGVIMSGLGRWHLIGSLGETTKTYVAGAVFAVVSGAVTWSVGYWTAHGEPILERVEERAAAVVGPAELATAVADLKGAITTAVAGQPPAAAPTPLVVQAAAPVIVQSAPTPPVEPPAPAAPAAPAPPADTAADPVLDLSGVAAA